MTQTKTHQEAKNPQMSARYLADYMAASERARRTIVSGCKYRLIARLVQHDEAKAIIANFMKEKNRNIVTLKEKALALRDRMASDAFERDVLDYNADYVDSFAAAYPNIVLPEAELLPAEKLPAISMRGVKVTVETSFNLRRITRTNKMRIGAAMLRYAKNKKLPDDVGAWQAAILWGHLSETRTDGTEPEKKLCLTVDAFTGKLHPAPSDSTSRFKDMEAACATIRELWPNIEPPAGAVLN